MWIGIYNTEDSSKKVVWVEMGEPMEMVFNTMYISDKDGNYDPNSVNANYPHFNETNFSWEEEKLQHDISLKSNAKTYITLQDNINGTKETYLLTEGTKVYSVPKLRMSIKTFSTDIDDKFIRLEQGRVYDLDKCTNADGNSLLRGNLGGKPILVIDGFNEEREIKENNKVSHDDYRYMYLGGHDMQFRLYN